MLLMLAAVGDAFEAALRSGRPTRNRGTSERRPMEQQQQYRGEHDTQGGYASPA